MSQPVHRHRDLRRRARPSRPSSLSVVDDALNEVDRDPHRRRIGSPTGTEVTPAIGTAAASTTILDNDADTSISIAADAVSVDEDAGTITFTVTRTGDAEGTQTVSYALSGTSQASDVASPATGSVTFAQGETTKTITLNLTDDVLDEINETVTVTLSQPDRHRGHPDHRHRRGLHHHHRQRRRHLDLDRGRCRLQSTSTPAPSPSP